MAQVLYEAEETATLRADVPPRRSTTPPRSPTPRLRRRATSKFRK